MQVTSKGRVTIPVEIRRLFGFTPGTKVEFEIKGETVVLRKAKRHRHRGRSLVARMRGRATVRKTTDEVMAVTRGGK